MKHDVRILRDIIQYMVRIGRTAFVLFFSFLISFSFFAIANASHDPCTSGWRSIPLTLDWFRCLNGGSQTETPAAKAPTPTSPSAPASAAPSNTICRDDDGTPIPCASPVPSMTSDTISPVNPKCKELISHPLFKATASNFATLGDDECQAYMDLAKYDRTGSPAGITMLNATFAKNLAAMLNAAKSKGINLSISSGYRSEKDQKRVNPNGYEGNAAMSKHTQGTAADLNYPDAIGSSKYTCDDGAAGSRSYQWVDRYAKNFKVDLYNNRHSRVEGECNHVEDTTGARGTGPGGAIASTGGPRGIGDRPQEFTRYVDGVKCKVIGGVEYCPNKSSGFGGLFGGNSDMGKMMQMMMGMQLGQGLGGTLGGLFGGGNSSSGTTQPTYSSAYPTAQAGGTTNTGGTSRSGDAIDDLFNALATTTGTTYTTTNTATVTASSTNVGHLEPPPPIRDENSFVNPISGAVPLTVNAHFTGGTSCSDSYDLSWGDGYRDVMPNIPPTSGNACTTTPQVNDISHTYSATGTYMVTLRQGIDLTSVATTAVRVLGTITNAGGNVPPPTVTGSMISASSTSALTSVLGGIGNLIAQFGEAIIGIFVH